jgi:hypothetical protein
MKPTRNRIHRFHRFHRYTGSPGRLTTWPLDRRVASSHPALRLPCPLPAAARPGFRFRNTRDTGAQARKTKVRSSKPGAFLTSSLFRHSDFVIQVFSTSWSWWSGSGPELEDRPLRSGLRAWPGVEETVATGKQQQRGQTASEPTKQCPRTITLSAVAPRTCAMSYT